jgi:hypothetical protein
MKLYIYHLNANGKGQFSCHKPEAELQPGLVLVLCVCVPELNPFFYL